MLTVSLECSAVWRAGAGILCFVPYEVQTPVFEGPLDLLLHLITREQVDLYAISLADIVDAYLVELDRMQGLDLDMATEFVLIAATLVEMKSRRLLPGRDALDLDDELGLWEERDLLLARLLECKTFKDAAHALERLAQQARRSVPRVAGPEERFLELAPDLLEGVTAADVQAAFLRVVTPRPAPHVDLDHVAPIRASVRDALAVLAADLPRRGVVDFHSLTRGIDDRIEVVVRFLAILELYKQGLVELEQAETFGRLEVRWVGAPAAAAAILAGADSYDG
jgi:segregation and condensation protein A